MCILIGVAPGGTRTALAQGVQPSESPGESGAERWVWKKAMEGEEADLILHCKEEEEKKQFNRRFDDEIVSPEVV